MQTERQVSSWARKSLHLNSFFQMYYWTYVHYFFRQKHFLSFYLPRITTNLVAYMFKEMFAMIQPKDWFYIHKPCKDSYITLCFCLNKKNDFSLSVNFLAFSLWGFLFYFFFSSNMCSALKYNFLFSFIHFQFCSGPLGFYFPLQLCLLFFYTTLTSIVLEVSF